MNDLATAPVVCVELAEVRHVEVAAKTTTDGDTIRHFDMWFKVRSVMTLNGDVCIALVPRAQNPGLRCRCLPSPE